MEGSPVLSMFARQKDSLPLQSKDSIGLRWPYWIVDVHRRTLESQKEVVAGRLTCRYEDT